MCAACADHNVSNRGARYVMQGETYILAWIDDQKETVVADVPPVAVAVATAEVAKAQATTTPDSAARAAAAPPAFTIDQVMQIYQDTKEAVETMSKRHAEEMEPLNKRIELTKAWMLDYLNKQGLENARTAHGLAYKSNVISATVDPEGGWNNLLEYIFKDGITRVLDAIEGGMTDREALVKFFESPALMLLNRAVNKTAVKDMMEQGVQVPGVKIATVTNLNVRKS